MKKNKNSKNPKFQLSSLMNKYDEYLKQRKEKTEKERSEQKINTEAFLKIRNEIIRPIFEKIKDEMERRGHKVWIETDEPSWNFDKNIPIDPSITFKLELITNVKRQSHYHDTPEIPYLSFVYSSLEKEVYRHKSTIGPGQIGYSGPGKKFRQGKITRKVVKEEMLIWLESLISDVAPACF